MEVSGIQGLERRPWHAVVGNGLHVSSTKPSENPVEELRVSSLQGFPGPGKGQIGRRDTDRPVSRPPSSLRGPPRGVQPTLEGAQEAALCEGWGTCKGVPGLHPCSIHLPRSSNRITQHLLQAASQAEGCVMCFHIQPGLQPLLGPLFAHFMDKELEDRRH